MVKCNQMTALRFQTGGRHKHPGPPFKGSPRAFFISLLNWPLWKTHAFCPTCRRMPELAQWTNLDHAPRSKARWSCAFTIPATPEIESEAVFRNRHCSLLWTVGLRLPNLNQPLLFPSAPQKKCVKEHFLVVVVMLGIKKKTRPTADWFAKGFTCFHRRSRLPSHFVDCSLDLHPSHAFDFGYLGDFTSGIFLRMGHVCYDGCRTLCVQSNQTLFCLFVSFFLLFFFFFFFFSHSESRH